MPLFKGRGLQGALTGGLKFQVPSGALQGGYLKGGFQVLSPKASRGVLKKGLQGAFKGAYRGVP